MIFKYQDKEYEFPTSLSKISLRQRIDFDKLYSKEIEALQNEVYQKDGKGNLIEPDELDVTLMNISIAIKNFSFFTGIPLSEVESSVSVDNVLNIYYSCFEGIYKQQNEIVLEKEYLWNGELWKIEQPKLTFESQITFNELIVSKQIVKQMHDLGSGNWEAMPFLAAIFLKRENETFQEKWLVLDSERVKMMYDLPMDIAIADRFFFANFNEYIHENFSVFGGGGNGKGPGLKSHFEKWGWLSFMTFVAKEGAIFYKQNGKSNIENIKETKAYDVLIWASEQKDHEEIINSYYESLNSTS